MSSLFNSTGIKALKNRLDFLRDSQNVVSKNIARFHVPGAVPEKIDEGFGQSNTISLVSSNGTSFKEATTPIKRKLTTDNDTLEAKMPGRSRISLSKELAKLASIDDEHNMGIKLLSAWKKAYSIAMGRPQ